jgi:hypothetical protein
VKAQLQRATRQNDLRFAALFEERDEHSRALDHWLAPGVSDRLHLQGFSGNRPLIQVTLGRAQALNDQLQRDSPTTLGRERGPRSGPAYFDVVGLGNGLGELVALESRGITGQGHDSLSLKV